MELEQSRRRLSQLEEEKRSTEQSLRRAQGSLDDLKGKRVRADQGDLGSFIITLLLFHSSKVRRADGGAEEASVQIRTSDPGAAGREDDAR